MSISFHVRNISLGRDRGMMALDVALGEALGSQGSLIMWAGETGIRKSRLAKPPQCAHVYERHQDLRTLYVKIKREAT